jgi:virginiamycin B lyase
LAAGLGAIWVMDDGSVVRVDPATSKVVATIRIPDCCGGGGVVTSDGAVWVSNEQADVVHRIDPATNKVSATIDLDPEVHDLAAAQEAVWVVDNSQVARIDPATNKVVATIPVGAETHSVAIDGGGVWAPSFDEQTVYRIDPNA